MSIRAVTLVLVALALPAMSASAQNRKTEIGFDGSFQAQITDEGGKYTQISLPGGVLFPEAGLRIAFPISDLIGIEPMIGYGRLEPDEGEGFSALRAVLGFIITPGNDPSRAHFYLRPYGAFDRISGGDVSETQFLLGGGVGGRFPIDDRLSFRLEGGYAHGFENDDFTSRDLLVLRVGLSMYLK